MNPLIIGAAVMFALFQGTNLLQTQAQPTPIEKKELASPINYAKSAEKDLDFIYGLLKTQSTHTWLTQGYREAQKKISLVNSLAAYHFLLSYYIYGFKHPEVHLQTNYKPAAIGFPGFLIKQSGNDFIVNWRHASLENLIPLGARLVSCDDQTPHAMLTHNMPYLPKNLNAEYAFNALLFQLNNPFATPIKEVIFEHHGKQCAINIKWLWLKKDEVSLVLAEADLKNDAFMESIGLLDHAQPGQSVHLPSKLGQVSIVA